MNRILENKFFRFLFFGNYFYGICVIALAIESSLQQRIALNHFSFYLLLFFATLFYYNLAFSKTDLNSKEENERLNWYKAHNRTLAVLQSFYFLISLVLIYFHLIPLIQNVRLLNKLTWGILFLFPLSALFYYGINRNGTKTWNLRNIGWLKPFIIGFVWAGVVGILPQLESCISNGLEYNLTLVGVLLFLKNFMYISVLSIMFDIKDYAKDYNYELKTFVVKFGLRKTIYSILLPLLLSGWLSFVIYGITRDFSWMKIVLNTLPFLLCIAVALELQKRKSIYFYLVIIDGLMLIKALCGSVAILYF